MKANDLDPFLQPFYRKGGTDCPFNDSAAEDAIDAADLPEGERARLRSEVERAARSLNAPMRRRQAPPIPPLLKRPVSELSRREYAERKRLLREMPADERAAFFRHMQLIGLPQDPDDV